MLQFKTSTSYEQSKKRNKNENSQDGCAASRRRDLTRPKSCDTAAPSMQMFQPPTRARGARAPQTISRYLGEIRPIAIFSPRAFGKNMPIQGLVPLQVDPREVPAIRHAHVRRRAERARAELEHRLLVICRPAARGIHENKSAQKWRCDLWILL